MLDLKNVSYHVDDQRILNQINFNVKKGEAIAFVGASGSGKSTLLRVIADLISPTEGDILFKGHSYQAYEPEILRRRVSYLPQRLELFGETIYDNLAFPSLARQDTFDKARAKALLEAVGLKKYKLNARVQHMSGGEQQRVTIARQLMYQPEVLLLDEATSALDDKNSQAIEKLIFEMVKTGTAVLWITHNIEQSHRHFHRIMTIHNGELVKEETV